MKKRNIDDQIMVERVEEDGKGTAFEWRYEAVRQSNFFKRVLDGDITMQVKLVAVNASDEDVQAELDRKRGELMRTAKEMGLHVRRWTIVGLVTALTCAAGYGVYMTVKNRGLSEELNEAYDTLTLAENQTPTLEELDTEESMGTMEGIRTF